MRAKKMCVDARARAERGATRCRCSASERWRVTEIRGMSTPQNPNFFVKKSENGLRRDDDWLSYSKQTRFWFLLLLQSAGRSTSGADVGPTCRGSTGAQHLWVEPEHPTRLRRLLPLFATDLLPSAQRTPQSRLERVSFWMCEGMFGACPGRVSTKSGVFPCPLVCSRHLPLSFALVPVATSFRSIARGKAGISKSPSPSPAHVRVRGQIFRTRVPRSHPSLIRTPSGVPGRRDGTSTGPRGTRGMDGRFRVRPGARRACWPPNSSWRNSLGRSARFFRRV